MCASPPLAPLSAAEIYSAIAIAGELGGADTGDGGTWLREDPYRRGAPEQRRGHPAEGAATAGHGGSVAWLAAGVQVTLKTWTWSGWVVS